MMRYFKLLIIAFLLNTLNTSAQSVEYEDLISKKNGTLKVHYFDNEPNAFADGESVKGIEVDILEQFDKWIKEQKGVEVSFDYTAYTNFDEMYQSVLAGKGNEMGIGTITITEKRKQEVDFSAPYMKNVSILVTSGETKTARSKAELKDIFSSMQAITVKGSIHEQHILAMSKDFGVNTRIDYVKDPMEIFAKIKESGRNFGYVDVIAFWKYLRENDHYVKMHSFANYKDENFGFIFPQNSGWAAEFNEFFESGFGFTSTKEYRKILEKHLSYEVLKSVELNP